MVLNMVVNMGSNTVLNTVLNAVLNTVLNTVFNTVLNTGLNTAVKMVLNMKSSRHTNLISTKQFVSFSYITSFFIAHLRCFSKIFFHSCERFKLQ